MEITHGHLYVVDVNPRIKTKPGKLRPALVIQSDLVNEAGYPSTIVIPTTTRLVDNLGILRLRLKKGQGGIAYDSDLLLGQLIAVSNDSFREEIGRLLDMVMTEVQHRVRIINLMRRMPLSPSSPSCLPGTTRILSRHSL